MKSTSVDAVITLIDTISSKLELVSQDYRGSDALKLELSLFHKLLLRTRCLRSNQSSFLYDLFEEVRHFCLILRSERRLEYVMVEEISRFRETLGLYQRRFCESNDTCLLDVVLDTLQTMDGSEDLGKLKLDLNLIRLYFVGTNSVSRQLPLSNEIYEEANKFCCVALKIADSSLNHELIEWCSSFRASLLKCCKHHIPRLQSDGTCDWYLRQLKEFYDSLSATLWDIYFWGQSHPRVNRFIRPIIHTVTFLKCFLCFATVKFDENCTFEWFFTHCRDSAMEAASLGFMCWFYRDDQEEWHQLESRSCELLEKVWPGSGNVQVTQNYEQTLLTSGLSTSSAFVLHWSDGASVVDFVGYLHDCLFQLVRHSTSAACLDIMEGLGVELGYVRRLDLMSTWRINLVSNVAIKIFQLYLLTKKDIEVQAPFLGSSRSSSRTVGHNLIKAILGNTYPRLLARRSLQKRLPRLIVNGVLVTNGVRGINQIKYQLMKNSAMGLDLIAVAGMESVTDVVFHDSDVKSHFEIQARCYCRSGHGIFNIQRNRKQLLQDILDCILSRHSYDYTEMSEDHIAQAVYNCLKGKRYLIVFYEAVRSQWRYLLSSFPKDCIQSKVLLASESIHDSDYFLRQTRMDMGLCCNLSASSSCI